VFHVDGSTFSMPDTPELRKAFGLPSGPKPGCGFPTAHLLVLFHAGTGLLLDAWASPLHTGDIAQVAEAHAHLEPGDVLIGDDTFSTYAHLAMLTRLGLHGLFPVHHRRIVDFTKGRPHTAEGKDAVAGMPRSRWVKSLGKEDQLVEYFKPQGRPAWMSRADYDALPDSVLVRELRRTVRRPGLGGVTPTMVTTLTDPLAYPVGELLELRLRRWDVETNLRHLKITMNMDVLRCKTERGVRKRSRNWRLRGHAGSGAAAGGPGRASQLRRRPEVDAARPPRRRAARPARQPPPPRPRRAPLQEAPAQAVRPDEQAP